MIVKNEVLVYMCKLSADDVMMNEKMRYWFISFRKTNV